MAKNKVFRRKYVLQFSGRSTDNFMPELLDNLVVALAESIDRQYKQTEVEQLSATDVRTGEVVEYAKKAKGL